MAFKNIVLFLAPVAILFSGGSFLLNCLDIGLVVQMSFKDISILSSSCNLFTGADSFVQCYGKGCYWEHFCQII